MALPRIRQKRNRAKAGSLLLVIAARKVSENLSALVVRVLAVPKSPVGEVLQKVLVPQMPVARMRVEAKVFIRWTGWAGRDIRPTGGCRPCCTLRPQKERPEM